MLWNVVNKERGKNNCPRLDVTEVIVNTDGSQFASKKDVVDALNNRFLGAAAACGAPRADGTRALRQLRAALPAADRSLRLRPFSADEVYRLITSLIPPKASMDIYGINMKLLRAAPTPLAYAMAELFNRCIREGTYPKPLKISKIAPIFKGKGKRGDMDAYRPVAIIPAMAKVLENGISRRLTSFLESTSALSDRQHAYRAGRSTTTLTRDVVRRVVDARERKQHVAILCCDLSRAFDVADHAVLTSKLRHYGIDGPTLSLFKSLLQYRSQIVVGDGGKARSDPLETTMGVAQGSSVSNILFSLLLNDLPHAIQAAEILMYADDVAAIVTAQSVDAIEEKLNETAAQLAQWFNVNGLALNLKKTHYLVFNLSGRSTRPLAVSANGTALDQLSSTGFLGFEIDTCLKWDHHIDRLSGRIGSACFALGRVTRLVSDEVARSCYFATVHSLLQYGAELWGRCAEWERVFRLQKRAIRIIARVPHNTPARPYFKKLGVLTLPAIVILQVAMYVRSNLSAYKTHSMVHKYNTRNAHKLVGVGCKMAKSAKLTHIMGPAVYNNLPFSITSAQSLGSFKCRLKRWLVEHPFYDYDEYLNFHKRDVK
ncbi:uncharacterized protein LOC134794580 [Cydia splendana]|uniref:uncharacterized protein LOC134794580 n=1 Tax=Cydia splendana TaxID=1100963 RepID=UPI00300D163E